MDYRIIGKNTFPILNFLPGVFLEERGFYLLLYKISVRHILHPPLDL